MCPSELFTAIHPLYTTILVNVSKVG